MKKLYVTSFLYLILGLLAGIFYREFTKASSFTEPTMLTGLHTHILTLGFLFFLILLLTSAASKLTEHKHFSKWFYFYNTGLLWTIITMAVRGVLEVQGNDIPGFNHIAGTGHFLLGLGLIWLMLLLKKSFFNKNA